MPARQVHAGSTRRFCAHAAHDGPPGRRIIEEAGFEAAALAFVETWHPPADMRGEVSVIVTDQDSGKQQCFRIDLETGEAGACE